MRHRSRLARAVGEFLSNSRAGLAVYAMVFSFAVYFCMYAFRKPFSVARYEGAMELPIIGELDQKILFVSAQLVGYTVSKFLGIKLVSESAAGSRGRAIVLLILLAQAALLGFALAPPSLRALFLFLNGLPLGLIWGLVFGYLEGRRLSVLFGTVLSVSFIVSSGIVKSAGRQVLVLGVSETWMPFATGLLFLPLLLACTWFLDLLPPPTAEEERLRAKRLPMLAQDRKRFLARYAPAVVGLTALYMLLTAYRDFRDNFAREIWDALGYAGDPAIFSTTEAIVALAVLAGLGGLVVIRDSRRSFIAMYAMMLAGVIAIGLGTFAFQAGFIGPVAWMVSSGFGVFMAYVPFGSIFYDNLIATTGFVGTAGFMIYVSDAFGYVGSVALLLYKTFGAKELSWLEFFVAFNYVTCAVCTTGLLAVAVFLARAADAPARMRGNDSVDAA